MINKSCNEWPKRVVVVLGIVLFFNPFSLRADTLDAVQISLKIDGEAPAPTGAKMSLPVSTLLDNEWGMQKEPGLNIRGAWDLMIKKKFAKKDLDCSNSPIVVAVIDTGVDFNHTSLRESQWTNDREMKAYKKIAKDANDKAKVALPSEYKIFEKLEAAQSSGIKTKVSFKEDSARKKVKDFIANYIAKNTSDVDHNGYSGDLHGWDFALNSPSIVDGHGHGTHLAGIISGKAKEARGFHGVCPGVKIMSLRYFANDMAGMKNLDNTVAAIRYAIKNGAKIINYSGGGAAFSESEYTALKEATKKGMLVVAAAGNERSDTKLHPYYPASYNLKNIISVAGIGESGKLIPASNWGDSTVDVAAPGGGILSLQQNESYGFMNGTSQATAFVTGLAALIWTANPKLTAGEVKDLIIRSSAKTAALKGKVKADGYADAESAVKMLAEMRNKSKVADVNLKAPTPRVISGMEPSPTADLKK